MVVLENSVCGINFHTSKHGDLHSLCTLYETFLPRMHHLLPEAKKLHGMKEI